MGTLIKNTICILSALFLVSACAKKNTLSSADKNKAADAAKKDPKDDKPTSADSPTPPTNPDPTPSAPVLVVPVNPNGDPVVNPDTANSGNDTPPGAATPIVSNGNGASNTAAVASTAAAPSAPSTTKPAAAVQAPVSSATAASDAPAAPQPKFTATTTADEQARAKTKIEEGKNLDSCITNEITQSLSLVQSANRKLDERLLMTLTSDTASRCYTTNPSDKTVEARVNTKLVEIAFSLFPEDQQLLKNYAKVKNVSLPAVVVAQEKIQAKVQPLSIELRNQGIRLYGSRDFRQPDNAINYTVKRIKGSITSEFNDVSKGIVARKSSVKQSSNIKMSYSFGLNMNSNKFYPLTISDGTDSVTVDYVFNKGSAESFKKGESVSIVLTQESVLKLNDFEMQKILASEFSDIKDLHYKFSQNPQLPQYSRTCNIGKGYFLGSHALSCADPDYTYRAELDEK